MIGIIQTGTLPSAEISAVIHHGLRVQLADGRPGKLAIVDDAGAVVDASPAVAREAWLVAIASYKTQAKDCTDACYQAYLRIPRGRMIEYSRTEQIQIELESLGIVKPQECTA